MVDLEVYETIRKWLTKLEAKSRGLDFSKSSTRRAGLYWLGKYLKFLSTTPERPTNPDALIVERLEQLATSNLQTKRKQEEFFEEWIVQLKREEYAPNSIATATGLIRSFYKSNYAPLQEVSTVRPYKVRSFKVPTVKELKKMCDIADLPIKAWMLAQKDCGLANGDLLSLSLNNLSSEFGTIKTQLKKGIVPVHIQIRREKTGERTDSFFGPNSIKVLKEYIELNGGSGRIFRSPSNPKKGMSARSIEQQVKAIAIKAKVATKDVPITPYCVTPNMIVLTNPKTLEISKIKDLESMVMTHKGRFRSIENVLEKDYEGDVLRISPYYTNMPLEVTPEHLLLTPRNGKDTWVQAKELKKEDLILAPRIKTEKTQTVDLALLLERIEVIPKQEGDLIRPKQGISRNPIKRLVTINKRIGRLIGYFLAEGCTNRRGLNICFNPTEKENIEDTIAIVREEFGFTGCTLVGRGGIYFASRLLAEFFEKICGKYAYNKHVPVIILDSPNKVKWEIIKGVLRGDGQIRNRYRNFTPVGQIDTTSRNLAFQLRLLLNSLGVIVSLCLKKQSGKHTTIKGRIVRSSHDIYNLCTASESWSLFAKHLGLNVSRSERQNPRSKQKMHRKSRIMNRAVITDDYVCTKIAKIEKQFYKGKVYDLTVHDDTSYLCQGILVHNSFRKFFNTNLKYAGVNEAIVEMMMGHSIGRVRGAYLVTGAGGSMSGMPISKLAEVYMQAYQSIDIENA